MSQGSSSLNLSSTSSGAQGGISGVPAKPSFSQGSRSSSETPRGSKRPPSALARVGSRSRLGKTSSSSSQPRSMNPVGDTENMQDVSSLVTHDAGGLEVGDGQTPLYFRQSNDARQAYVDQRQLEVNQQVNQVYVAPAVDAHVVANVATAVMDAQQQAYQARMSAQQHVAEVTSEVRSQAMQAVSDVERQALQRVLSQQTEFAAREAQLKAQLEEARKEAEVLRQNLFQLVSSSPQNASAPECPNSSGDLGEAIRLCQEQIRCLADRQVDFEMKAKSMWDDIRETLESLSERVSACEGWYEEVAEEAGSPLVRLSSPGGSPVRHSFGTKEGQSAPSEDAGGPARLEDECLRWKDVALVKLPPLPDSAGGLRSWKNSVLPVFMALDCSSENALMTWLMAAFNARSPAEVALLRTDSQGFDRFDRVLCSWLTKPESLKGHFGTRIQSYLEESLSSGLGLRGRPILNFVVREFDLDSALGSVISAVELFQIPSPEADNISSLESFRDKVQFILNQLPLPERPTEAMLSKWLFERLKRVRPLQLTIDRIKESPSIAMSARMSTCGQGFTGSFLSRNMKRIWLLFKPGCRRVLRSLELQR